MAIDEITEAQIWMRAALLASPDIVAGVGQRVYSHPARRDTPYPFISYMFQSAPSSVMLVGTAILWSQLRFLVRAFVRGEDQTIVQPISAAIFAALHGKFGFTANAEIVSCVRDRPFTYVEETDSDEFIQLGGEYLVTVRPRTP